MVVESSIYKFTRFWIFVLFLRSMYPWIGIEVPTSVFSIIGIAAMLILGRSTNRGMRQYTGWGLAIFAMLAIMSLRVSMNGVINFACIFYISYSLMKLPGYYKDDIIKYITKWFSILLAISLVFYVLHAFSVPLPRTLISFREYNKDNYFFFLSSEKSFRFQSIFLEPGHMTMGLAPLLFINKYNVKNRSVLVLLISQLFSFSLAGYLVSFIGYIFVSLCDNSTKIKVLIRNFFIFFILLYGFTYVSTKIFGLNLLESAIFDRLVFEDGQMVGYNRSGAVLDNLFESTLSSSNKWFGIDFPYEIMDKGVAGYKVYVVTYGIIGTFFALMVYMYPFFIYKKRIITCLCVVMILLLFQNAYPDWWCMLICLICGSNYLSNNE